MQAGLEGYKKWRDGEREALEETVVAYNKRLIFYIGSILGDYAAAEDIASETFLRLLIKKPSLDTEEQLCSWLYKTARNLASDRIRHGRFEEIPEEMPESADERELVDALIVDERKRLLHETIRELKSEYKDVLILLYFSEMSYAEVSKVLKKNETQVKNLAFRARQSLKEKLERKGFTYED